VSQALAPGLAAEAPVAGAPWRRLFFSLAVFVLLIYSQAWVFPLMGEEVNESAGGLIRALFLPAYAAGAVLAFAHPLRLVQALARQPFLIALMLMVGVSLAWSVEPDQTARRAFAVRYSWAQIAEAMGACFAILAVASLLASIFLPRVGVMPDLFPGAWRGLWPEKNAFGGNMAIAFVIMMGAAALNPARARLWWGFAGLAFLLVLASTSKTSLLAALLGLGALAFVALARRGPAAGVIMVWLAILGVTLAAFVALFASDAVFALLGKDATLTGRTKIWDAAMRQIALRPMTGYGYGAVWTEKGSWGPLAWIIKHAGFRPQHAHNSWIEQWLGMGVWGLGAFALFYAQMTLLALVAIFRNPGAFLAVPLLLVYTLMSLTESIAVAYNDLRWVLIVIVAVKLALPDRGAEA
jgi:O-antigen ligase